MNAKGDVLLNRLRGPEYARVEGGQGVMIKPAGHRELGRTVQKPDRWLPTMPAM